jgi:hypothetical protein
LILDEKLKHLSEQQIEEVIRKYENKSIKLAEIISDYKIDVKPAGLLKILPPVKTENSCIHCGCNLYHEREGRTSYNCNDVNKTMFCDNCGHKENPKLWGRIQQCECQNCVSSRLRLIQEKRNLIKHLYEEERSKISFHEMEFRDQVDLIYILLNNPNRNTFEVASVKFDLIDKKQWMRRLNRLLDIKAISVSPNTEISAFKEDNFPYTVFIDKAVYNINVSFSDDTIDQINSNIYFSENISLEERLIVLKEYIYTDAINRFSEFLMERHLELNIADNANDRFIDLIDTISYTQLISLCIKVAKYFSDKVVTGEMNKKAACNAALLNVSKFYDNAIDNSWELHHLDYKYAGEELRYYVEKILGKKLSLLKMPISVDIIENADNIEKNYDRDTKNYFQE